MHSRRSFLAMSGAAVCGCAMHRSFAVALDGRAPISALSQLPYPDVQLLDGPLLRQFQEQQKLFLGIDDDVLLKPFRQRAGLPAPGADMGGWYDDSADFHIDPNDWGGANWHGFIAGHSFGQYLSGLARGYAITRDPATRAKVFGLVEKYAATISPKFFDDYNLPAYTYDKLVVGLIDAHTYAGAPGVREALDRLTDAALPYLPDRALTREERRALPYKREAQIWDEPYTLPENLFLATERGLGDRYATLARRYLQDGALFDPLAAGRSPFAGKHAYSHVNALSSAMQAWIAGAGDKYFDAARNGFRFVDAQSYATGGWGPNEELLASDDVDGMARMLEETHRSFETPCGAYAHFKIARSLLRFTRDNHYGDSMERVLYNTILGALPTRPNGDTFYYSDYHRDGRKVYRGEAWPCCSGTFAQLTADYGISAYLLQPGQIHVNLYVPSRVSFDVGGQRVTLTQTTDYPFDNVSRFTVDVEKPVKFGIALRLPEWAGPATRTRVNGKVVKLKSKPPTSRPSRISSIAQVATWKRGDTFEIEFDMAPRLEPLDARHANLVALMVGPLALFPVGAADAPLSREALLAAKRHGRDEWHVKSANGVVRCKPFMSIGDEAYRLYSRTT